MSKYWIETGVYVEAPTVEEAITIAHQLVKHPGSGSYSVDEITGDDRSSDYRPIGDFDVTENLTIVKDDSPINPSEPPEYFNHRMFKKIE